MSNWLKELRVTTMQERDFDQTGWENPALDNAIRRAMQKLGFVYFERGEYNCNVIAIRNDITPRDNEFDDLLTIGFYHIQRGERRKALGAWLCTTEPGRHWLKTPISEAAKSGAAIWKCPQQVRGSHQYGLHSANHWGLIQAKPIEIVRDSNWNGKPETEGMQITKGQYFCNIHGSYGVPTVENQSAGCIATKAAYNSEAYYRYLYVLQQGMKNYGNSFTTTLIPASALFDGRN